MSRKAAAKRYEAIGLRRALFQKIYSMGKRVNLRSGMPEKN